MLPLPTTPPLLPTRPVLPRRLFGTRAMRLILQDCATTGLAPAELFRLERARTLCSLRTAVARVTRQIRAAQRDPADDLVSSAALEGAWPRQEPR